MNTIAAWLEHPLVARLGWCLVHSVWEIAAVALVAALLLRILRRGNARGRYLAACASLVVMAALPVVTLAWASAFRADARASFSAGSLRQGTGLDAKSPDLEDPALGPRKDEVVIQAEPPRAPAGPRFSDQVEPWLPLLVTAWGLGVVVPLDPPAWRLAADSGPDSKGNATCRGVVGPGPGTIEWAARAAASCPAARVDAGPGADGRGLVAARDPATRDGHDRASPRTSSR